MLLCIYMHPIWSGSLSFGLVNIPVKLFSATAGTKLDLDYLHKNDLSPIRYARVCRKDGKEIPYEDIVRGYEYQKGDYVVLTEEDFKNVDLKKTESLDVFAFVDQKEIDSIYLEKPYFLEPDKGASKAYAVLCAALAKSGKVGLCRFVLRDREHLGAIKAMDNLLVLDQLRFEDEIATTKGLHLPAREEIRKKEVDMALELIGKLADHFEPEKYHDTYRDQLDQVIKEKVEGRVPKAKGKAPEPTRVHDLMSTLKASLEHAHKSTRRGTAVAAA